MWVKIDPHTEWAASFSVPGETEAKSGETRPGGKAQCIVYPSHNVFEWQYSWEKTRNGSLPMIGAETLEWLRKGAPFRATAERESTNALAEHHRTLKEGDGRHNYMLRWAFAKAHECPELSDRELVALIDLEIERKMDPGDLALHPIADAKRREWVHGAWGGVQRQRVETAEALTSVPTYRIESLWVVSTREPTPQLIEGVGGEGTFGFMFGPSGTLKSALLMGLGVASASPSVTHWMGRKVAQGAMLYIAAEGAGGLRNRCRAQLMAVPDAPDDAISFIRQATPLNVEGNMVALRADVFALLPRLSLPLLWIVWDTYSQNTPGADENSSKDFTLAEMHCRNLLAAVGERQGTAPIGILVHHTGHGDDTRPRGSSAMIGNPDFILGTRKEGRDQFVLWPHKAKDSDTEWRSHYRKVVHTWDEKSGNLDPASSIVAEYVTPGEAWKIGTAQVKLPKPDSQAGKVWRAMTELWEADQTVAVPHDVLRDQGHLKALMKTRGFSSDPGRNPIVPGVLRDELNIRLLTLEGGSQDDSGANTAAEKKRRLRGLEGLLSSGLIRVHGDFVWWESDPGI